jgi:hypothetical protein
MPARRLAFDKNEAAAVEAEWSCVKGRADRISLLRGFAGSYQETRWGSCHASIDCTNEIEKFSLRAANGNCGLCPDVHRRVHHVGAFTVARTSRKVRVAGTEDV